MKQKLQTDVDNCNRYEKGKLFLNMKKLNIMKDSEEFNDWEESFVEKRNN